MESREYFRKLLGLSYLGRTSPKRTLSRNVLWDKLKVKEESEKVGLKLNIQKTKITASSPFMAYRWGNSGNSVRLYFSGLQNDYKSLLQPLKDAYSLEGKL